MVGVGVSAVLFGLTRHFAGPPPKTLTKEYQEATERYFKVKEKSIHSILEPLWANCVPFEICVLIDCPLRQSGTRNRAHHRVQGHAGAEQVREIELSDEAGDLFPPFEPVCLFDSVPFPFSRQPPKSSTPEIKARGETVERALLLY